MTLKERYLYNRAISTEESKDYIKAICTIKDTDKALELLNVFLVFNNLSEFSDKSNIFMEKLLIKYLTRYGSIALKKVDFEYIVKAGLFSVILEYENLLIKKNRHEELLYIARLTKVYDEKVFKTLQDKKTLHKLYCGTKDNVILFFVLDNVVINVDVYENYAPNVDEVYKEKFLDKMMKDNKVYEILNTIHSDYHKDVLKGWRKHKQSLSAKDIYAIIQYKVYEEDDIQFLVTKACELMDAENIYLFLSGKYPITSELTLYQKEKLEKALKKTRNIEYNFYYEYKKDKDELIRKMGGIAALIVFILANKINLEAETEIHDELCLLAEESFLNDTFIENVLFKDDEKSCKESIKRRKKEK